MNISPLAQRIMMVAAEHNVHPGQALPEAAFDLFLNENAGHIGDALLELYMEGLLEEVPHEVDILTVEGLRYIQAQSVC